MLRVLLLIVVLGVAISPAYAQQSINPNPDLSLVWEHLSLQPDDFSVACSLVNNPAYTVLYNAEERFPLASVSKLLILIEYVRRVDAGQIFRDEMVAVDALNIYDLPGTNRGAHDDFMALYPPGTRYISLWDIATIGMIQYSSNAASDYLLARLAPIDWEGLYRQLHMDHTDFPHPLSVIALMMDNHIDGQATMRDVTGLSLAHGEELLSQYVQDEQWREAEIAFRNRRGRAFPGWNVQGAILQDHTATGTAEDFLRLMAAIYGQGSPLSPSARMLIQAALRWRNYPAIDTSYIEYGSKLGFWSGGTMTLVAYGYPRGGTPVISVAFFRNINRQRFYQMLNDDTIGNLAHWLNLSACSRLGDQLPR